MNADRLEELCRDRELETPEICTENGFYGMASILKRYAGLPADEPLKAVIPHGVCLDSDFVSKTEIRCALPLHLCYPPYRARAVRRKTHKRVVLSAAPYCYLMELSEAKREDPRGTLFFPAHSTHHITTTMNYERLADRLVRLDERFQPVHVCLYWRDYNLGRAEPFLERGLEVVSAGHMFDDRFLYRLHELCCRYRYAASNELGSHIFYSVKSGCSFFLLGSNRGVRRSGRPEMLPANLMQQDEEITGTIRRLFGEPVERPTAEQRSFVDRVLGAEYLRTPEELRSLLERAESLDRWGVWFKDRLPAFPLLNRSMGRFYPATLFRRLKSRLTGN